MFQAIDEPAIKALVEAFYAKVRADELIGPVFNDAIDDWPHHLAKLQDFWSSVMLTSGRYKGQPLPAHVKHGERIVAASFERWLALWAETTGEMFAPEVASLFQQKANRIAQSLQLGIHYARGGELTERPRMAANG